MEKQSFKLSEVEGIPSPRGRARVGADSASSEQRILPSLEFVGSPQLTNKFFSLPRRDRRVAFTLAEVLITLGVIGVVAAMTMPSVINKAQQYVLRQQFKKSVNILSNAVRKTYADMEYTPHCSYGLNDGTNNGTECIVFHEKLVKNLKTIKYCPNKALENGCITDIKGLDTVARSKDPNLSEEDARKNYANMGNFREHEIHNAIPAWVLADGQTFLLYANSHPLYLVDINGKKGPNKWGYDIYTFILDKYTIQCYFDAIENGGTGCTTLMQNNK